MVWVVAWVASLETTSCDVFLDVDRYGRCCVAACTFVVRVESAFACVVVRKVLCNVRGSVST